MRIVMLCTALGLLAACATPYEPKGDSVFSSYGYSHTQLGVDTFDVYFTGRDDEQERARDFILMRSAELCMTHSYNYFVIVEQDPEQPQSRSGGLNTGIILSGGRHGGGIVPVVATRNDSSNHNMRNRIKCSNTAEPQANSSTVVYEAGFVRRSIADKYQLNS